MTPEEFRDKMLEIRETGGDPEATHGWADDTLCELLRSLGYGEGVAIFESLEKWYA